MLPIPFRTKLRVGCTFEWKCETHTGKLLTLTTYTLDWRVNATIGGFKAWKACEGGLGQLPHSHRVMNTVLYTSCWPLMEPFFPTILTPHDWVLSRASHHAFNRVIDYHVFYKSISQYAGHRPGRMKVKMWYSLPLQKLSTQLNHEATGAMKHWPAHTSEPSTIKHHTGGLPMTLPLSY